MPQAPMGMREVSPHAILIKFMLKNSSYYIASVGDWTHDHPHTVASNMVKVSHAHNHTPRP